MGGYSQSPRIWELILKLADHIKLNLDAFSRQKVSESHCQYRLLIGLVASHHNSLTLFHCHLICSHYFFFFLNNSLDRNFIVESHNSCDAEVRVCRDRVADMD